MLGEVDREFVTRDIDAYLDAHQQKGILRLLTCGSVDDGKSTLIGRLLYDSKQLYEDQLASLESDSSQHGRTRGGVDYALLLDGLKSEREQGITIDIAYRFFSTQKRKFIIADAPGHDQYTRNMATGASNCDLAIVLVDARYGVLSQTKRHSFIVSLLGIKHVVLAVNKMDLENWSEERFEQIKAHYVAFASRLDIPDIHFMPISALVGDNVVDRSVNMPWYHGSTLMELLETVHIASDRNLIDFRLPVQYVKRPDLNFRGFAGTIASGIVRPGNDVVVLPSGKRSVVKQVFAHGEAVDEAFAGIAATLTLDDQIDISRGDLLCKAGNLPHLARELDAMLVWMHENSMRTGSSYMLKTATNSMRCTIADLKYRVDINTLRREPNAVTLELNDIGRVHVDLVKPLAFDIYTRNRTTGGFILIDRNTNATVAAGMIIDRGNRPAKAVIQQHDHVLEQQMSAVTDKHRRSLLGHGAACIWLTGLPKAGKTSIAYALERRLVELGVQAGVIDSRRLRQGLNNDLGYSIGDRSENVRRLGHLAHLQIQFGQIVIVASVSPGAMDRARARNLIGDERFIEIYLATDIAVCKERDDEGVYGEFGPYRENEVLLALYEPPVQPDAIIKANVRIDEAVEQIVGLLEKRGMLGDRAQNA